MASAISVPYTLLMDSGITEGFPPDGPFALVKFKVLTSNRYQLIQDPDRHVGPFGQPDHADLPLRVSPLSQPDCACDRVGGDAGTGVPLNVGAAWVSRSGRS